MSPPLNPELDLTIARVIRAPRARVWQAWTEPAQLEQWWIPAPARCRVVTLEPRAGGALVTEMSENGAAFGPHMNACYLAVEAPERLVFTTCLVGGWRPAESPFITAVITLAEHADGTAYAAHVMHKSGADRRKHEELGFLDGWGAVADQLVRLVE